MECTFTPLPSLMSLLLYEKNMDGVKEYLMCMETESQGGNWLTKVHLEG